MSRAYTISSSAQERSFSQRRSLHPLMTMFLSGVFFIASVTVVFVAALLRGRA